MFFVASSPQNMMAVMGGIRAKNGHFEAIF